MAEGIVQSVREMYNYDRRTRYHKAFYSLDAFDWTEKYALEHSPSAEEIILMKEEQAAHEKLLARTIPANNAMDLAFFKRNVHIIQYPDALKRLYYIFHDNRIFHVFLTSAVPSQLLYI